MHPVKTVRIFLSSPGDVAADRAQARELLLGLTRGPYVRGRVFIDVVSSDDPHAGVQMDARLTPQQAVNRSLPTPAECDLTVVLVGARMGTSLTETRADGTPYLSGTEWEFQNALAANKPVFVYRRASPWLSPGDPELEEKLDQWKRVEAFFGQMTGYVNYESTAELLDGLMRDVGSFLNNLLDEATPIAEPQAGDPWIGAKGPAPSAGATTVFICYRREDSQDAAGRLYDRLVTVYGQDRVFIDIDSVPLGIDFVDHVSEQIARCTAVIVVIGKQWLKARDKGRRRRLDNENDFVRAEVAAALQQKVPVIPVLVQDANMPIAEELPENMRALARRNGMELSASRWRTDVERLVKELDRVMKG